MRRTRRRSTSPITARWPPSAGRQGIDLVVVGPEGPLVAGIADDLAAPASPSSGRRKAAARLEGSKGYTKELCAEAGIPTGGCGRGSTTRPRRAPMSWRDGAPMVVKADGLAAGKGVTVAMTVEEAVAAIDDCFAGLHGAAGASVVIEEFLEGEEASFFVLSDGETALPLATAQDHKRAVDGDTGPNTGGMGAYSPAPVMTPALVDRTHGRDRRAHHRRDAGARHAVSRRALCRADAHRRGAEADRVQCPLRRSRRRRC